MARKKKNTQQTLKGLKLGDSVIRETLMGTTETALIVAVETQASIERYTILSHRYGIIELTGGQPIRGKNDWMSMSHWKNLKAREARHEKLRAQLDAEEDGQE